MKRRLDISSLILFSSSSYVVDIAQYVVCSLCLQKVNCICSLSSQAGGFPEESTVKAPTPSVYTPDLWPFCMKPCDWPLLDQLIALLPTPTWSLGQALPMPNAFQAWDSDAKAAVMSGLGKTQQTPPIPPGAAARVLESCLTSVTDGRQVGIYRFFCFGNAKNIWTDMLNDSFTNPFVTS